MEEAASEGSKTLAESTPLVPPTADPLDDVAEGATSNRRRPADSGVSVSDTVAAESSRRRGRHGVSVSVPPPRFDREGESEKESFRVGDLVWGKLTNNTWWPGKVVNPSEHSSSMKKNGEGRQVLVIFFGDDSVSWHKPSQLKPFIEEFKVMVKQSSSKRFAAALTEALVEVKNIWKLEMAKLLSASVAGDGVIDRSVSKYALDVPEFLDLLLVAARDVLSIDKLEVTMLSSWAMAFQCQNKPPVDIMEKEALNSTDDTLGEEREFAGDEGTLLKRADLLDDLKQKRKERSIAELIADKDSEIKDQNVKEGDAVLDKLDQSALKSCKRKKNAKSGISYAGKNVHVPAEGKALELKNEDSLPAALIEQDKDAKSKDSYMDNGEDEVIEQPGYSRRERKKSKYLSPPYTNVVGHIRHIVLFKDEPVETSEKCDASKVSLDESPTNHEGNQNQEENESASVFKYNQVSAAEILSKFFLAAADPFYLKWNRSAKMVRNFISIFRGFVYSDSPNFFSCRNKLDGLGSGVAISKGKDLGVGSEKRKDSKKRNRLKDRITDETSVNPGENLTAQNGTRETTKRRKISQDNAVAETPKLDWSDKKFSKKAISGKRRQLRKSVDGKGAEADTSQGFNNSLERDQLSINKHKIASNGFTRNNPGDSGSSKLKTKKCVNKSNNEAILKLDQKQSTGSEVINSREEDSRRMLDSPVSLVLTYVPGTILPSKEEIISIHSAYGALVESDIQHFEDSHSVCVVFKRLSHAKKAVKSLYTRESLPPSVAKYELHKPANLSYKSQRTPGSRTPLPYIRNNLEKMISKLSGYTPTLKDERISNHLEPEVRDTLVGEMSSLLKKVDMLLTGPSSGNQA